MNKIIVKIEKPDLNGLTYHSEDSIEVDLDTLSIDKVGPYFLYSYNGGKMIHKLGYYDLKYWLPNENNEKCINLMKEKYPEWFLKI